MKFNKIKNKINSNMYQNRGLNIAAKNIGNRINDLNSALSGKKTSIKPNNNKNSTKI